MPGALELLGVRVALMLHERQFAHAHIALSQRDAVLPGELDEPHARPIEQPRVGREHHRLFLHRRVDDHVGEIGDAQRLRLHRDGKALLHQRVETLLAHALAPARDRRAVERQFVAEELLAAEELEVGVLDPARAQRLVGQIVRVLEDRQPRHQPRRQRRLAGYVGIGRAAALLDEAPVDQAREADEFVVEIEDLVETGAEHVRLPGLGLLRRQHDRLPGSRPMHAERESCFGASREEARQVLQDFCTAHAAKSCNTNPAETPAKPMPDQRLRAISRTTRRGPLNSATSVPIPPPIASAPAPPFSVSLPSPPSSVTTTPLFEPL